MDAGRGGGRGGGRTRYKEGRAATAAALLHGVHESIFHSLLPLAAEVILISALIQYT